MKKQKLRDILFFTLLLLIIISFSMGSRLSIVLVLSALVIDPILDKIFKEKIKDEK